MFKISGEIVENFIKSEFQWKGTNSREIRVNSIYTTDTKYKCYIDPDNFVFCDFKSGNAGSCYWLFEDFLGLNNKREVLMYIMKNYAYGDDKLVWEQNSENALISNDNVIEEFIQNDNPVFFIDKEKIGSYGKRCLKYLMDRKIDVEYIRQMGYVYGNSIFNKRIIIPYMESGKLAYFQARSIDKNNPLRYLNPAGLDTKGFVFNYDKLNDEELIICEGPFDAMSLDEQVATSLCSGDLSPKQVKKILTKVHPKNLIFVVDQDKTGREKLEKNINTFTTYADYSPNIYIFNPTDGCKDMNELKVKTGKNYILRSECEKYTKSDWNLDELQRKILERKAKEEALKKKRKKPKEKKFVYI